MGIREIQMVKVEWRRSAGDTASEGACSIGDRRYEGRAGEQMEMRADDAAILAAGGFVSYVVELA